MAVDPSFWSIHTHSRYSANDALPTVDALVTAASNLGYPALALTDHGNMCGAIELYRAARKIGIEPLPGVELYLTPDAEALERSNYHLIVAAYTETGYRNLTKLVTQTARRYYYRPRIDLADLAAMAEAGTTAGLVVSTGCYFGLVAQTLLKRGVPAAAQLVTALAGWFPRVYIELQNHGIERDEDGYSDDDLVAGCLELAQVTGLPYLIAQDSHYLAAKDQPLHDGLKRLVSFSDDQDDAVFPGDGYHLVDQAWLARYFEPEVLSTALVNLADLASRASVRIPELEAFRLKVPDVTYGRHPQEVLQDRIAKAAVDYPDVAYAERITTELRVIDTSGMASYLLLVAEVTDFMREKGIWFHARGSASGSLVCMLLGITQVDPISWGLRFDRFLSTDRTRPPDIDLDVEHRRREEVTEMLAQRYSILQVGTHMQYSLFDEEEDESKGSLRVRYYSSMRKRGHRVGMWRDVPVGDRVMLKRLADMKLISSFGAHPGGYVIAPDEVTLAQLPMSYISSSKTFITSYSKKDVERLGFVKLDLLGLRNKTANRISCEAAGVDWNAIPNNDKATMTRIADRRTDGIFQLEGFAMTKGLARLVPKTVADLVAAQALFRPATMNSGATGDYLARRKGLDPVPARHEDLMAEMAETYGVLLYQEQVIGVLRRILMPADELTDTLDAIKASNAGTVAAKASLIARLPRIRQLAIDRGWSEPDIGWFSETLISYAEYSFGKAHAASYGVVSYRTAYLAEHYPLEFWVGMLEAFDDHKKAPLYIRAANRNKVRVLPAHVNESKVTYSIDRDKGAIRRGLLAVKGVGQVAATELVAKAPYSSLLDLADRVIPRRVAGAKQLALGVSPADAGGVIAGLFEAGALERIPIERI